MPSVMPAASVMRRSCGSCARWNASIRVGGEVQRRGQSAGIDGDGGVDFRRGDAQAVGGQRQAVEAGGVVDQRRIAVGAHVGDDVGDGAVDGLGGFARLREQGGESAPRNPASAVERRIMRLQRRRGSGRSRRRSLRAGSSAPCG